MQLRGCIRCPGNRCGWRPAEATRTVIVVVLTVTPKKLRGELTRWLLEIDTGVYVGHASERVRENLWDRIVEDVGRGRAIMVWSSRGEQRLKFAVHNHAWNPVDLDGVTLMRRVTAESREIASRQKRYAALESSKQIGSASAHGKTDSEAPDEAAFRPRPRSKAGFLRKYGTAVEQRRRDNGSLHESE